MEDHLHFGFVAVDDAEVDGWVDAEVDGGVGGGVDGEVDGGVDTKVDGGKVKGLSEDEHDVEFTSSSRIDLSEKLNLENLIIEEFFSPPFLTGK